MYTLFKMNARVLNRSVFRDGIAHAVLDLLVSGALPPASRLKDTDLAERLGTSRTPVREALIELVRRGFVEAVPHRGFRVPPLRRQEVLELYPLVATLESLAIETSSDLAPAQARALARVGQTMVSAGLKPARWLRLDQEWHETLLAGCPNERLLAILSDLRLQIQRYELVYAKLRGGRAVSAREHAAIAKAFRDGEREHAAKTLRTQWERSMNRILRQLE